jgi:two-component system, OmpR family, response regulator PhoP
MSLIHRCHDVTIPILVLIARESWQDKVEVLGAGADGCVTNPQHGESGEQRSRLTAWRCCF